MLCFEKHDCKSQIGCISYSSNKTNNDNVEGKTVPAYFQQHRRKVHCLLPSFATCKSYVYQYYITTSPPKFQQTDKQESCLS